MVLRSIASASIRELWVLGGKFFDLRDEFLDAERFRYNVVLAFISAFNFRETHR